MTSDLFDHSDPPLKRAMHFCPPSPWQVLSIAAVYLGITVFCFYGFVALPKQDERTALHLKQALAEIAGTLRTTTGKVETFLKTARFYESRGGLTDRELEGWSVIFTEVFQGDPLIGGLSIIDSNGRSWGIGKYRENAWVRVFPANQGRGAAGKQMGNLLEDLDAQGRGIAGSQRPIPPRRLSSPWTRLPGGTVDPLWTSPFTSTTIAAPVISASVRAAHPQQRVIAAHIRLPDLSALTEQARLVDSGIVAIVDQHGRVLGLPRLAGVPQGAAGEAQRLEALMLPLRELDTPIRPLFEAWLESDKRCDGLIKFTTPSGEDYLGMVQDVSLGSNPLYILVAVPAREFSLLSLATLEAIFFTLLCIVLSRIGCRIFSSWRCRLARCQSCPDA